MAKKIRRIAFITIVAIFMGLFPKAKVGKLDAAPSRKFIRNGLASFYSKRSPGIKPRTANNEIFDDNALTCAMWGVAFDRMVKVTNLENGKSIVVRVNDRGPHERFVRAGRIIDLTKLAFSLLNPTPKGLINVQVEFL